MDTDTRRARACLLLQGTPGLGFAAQRLLLDRFPAEQLLGQTLSEWCGAGLTRKQAQRLAVTRDNPASCLFDLDKAMDTLAALDTSVITPLHQDYPPLLHAIEDPPPILYVRGQAHLLKRTQLAMVGSRRASLAGKRMASALAGAAVRSELAVTSGLALGIDGASHRGALEAGGASVAVMATGIERIYPARHRPLAEALAETGALVTEWPPGTPPQRGHFPRRNRIISGLSLFTLVVEAALPSGSLLTAAAAGRQGRDVGAVPWSSLHRGGEGCLQLLREGAALVAGIDDVLDALGWFERRPEPQPTIDQQRSAPPGLSGAAGALLGQLDDSAQTLEQLSRDSGVAPDTLQRALTELELAGLVERSMEGVVRR